MKSIREILADFLFWVLGISFFIGLITVYAAAKSSKFNVYIFGFGIIMMSIPALIYWISDRKETKELTDTIDKEINRLKRKGIKLKLTSLIVR